MLLSRRSASQPLHVPVNTLSPLSCLTLEIPRLLPSNILCLARLTFAHPTAARVRCLFRDSLISPSSRHSLLMETARRLRWNEAKSALSSSYSCSHTNGPWLLTWARWQASSNLESSVTVAALSPEEADSSSLSASKKAGFGGVSCSARSQAPLCAVNGIRHQPQNGSMAKRHPWACFGGFTGVELWYWAAHDDMTSCWYAIDWQNAQVCTPHNESVPKESQLRKGPTCKT